MAPTAKKNFFVFLDKARLYHTLQKKIFLFFWTREDFTTHCKKKYFFIKMPNTSSPHAAETRTKRLALQRTRRMHHQEFENKNQFIRLCRKYMMRNDLDSVGATTHLANATTTIFLIGEQHQPHTKCKSIFEMFTRFIEEVKRFQRPFQIDLMIELYQYEVEYNLRPYVKARDLSGANQILSVRRHFAECVVSRDCPVRVHWTDATENSTNRKRHIPNWLREMGQMSAETTYPPSITRYFPEGSDASRFITENPYVMKEIQKANEVNPAFTLDFVLDVFQALTVELSQDFHGRDLAWFMIRCVVDIYTAARIIHLKMKYVVYYAGAQHTDNLIKILNALDFDVLEHDVKTGECAPSNPPYPYLI